MQNVPIGIVIQKSFERTMLILLKPFSLKKWFFLLTIVSLAGSLGGGSMNFGGGGRDSSRDKKTDTQQEEIVGPLQREGVGEQYRAQENLTSEESKQCPVSRGGIRRSLRETFQKTVNSYGRTLVFTVIGIIVFLALAFIIFFTWLGARFKFVWLQAILNNDASIREPFRRYRKEGNSLFKFFLLLFGVFIAWIGLLGVWVWSSASSVGLFDKGADVSFLTVVKIFALPAIVFIIGLIAFAILGVIVEHFVVTIMGMGQCLFRQAWNKCMQIASQNRTDFFLFFLLLIGLGIASGIIGLILLLICLLVMVIVGALLFGLPYLLIVVALKVPILFYSYAIVVGIPFVLAAILLFAGMSLPFAVFFRNFSLYYLSGLAREYAALPLTQNLSDTK